MTPVYVDAQGKEHQLVIASEDRVVHDPLLGFDRRIVAGQPVPPELAEAYDDAKGGAKGRAAKPSVKDSEKGNGPDADRRAEHQATRTAARSKSGSGGSKES